jgi:hypothetical protein
MLAILLVPVVALILGVAEQEGWAQDDPVCWFNIELNATDLDVGVRGFFDYDPWEKLEIEDPNDKEIAKIKAKKSLADQGFAELFFESGEPELSELSFSELFDRFPEGFYEFEAETTEDDEVECEELFTHVIPCAPDINAAGNSLAGVTITWESVDEVVDTETTDDNIVAELDEPLACEEPEVLVIIGYEVIVETADEKRYTIELPGTATSVTVPPEFIELGDEFQYEVLAIEANGNQTITEEEFCLDDVGVVGVCD